MSSAAHETELEKTVAAEPLARSDVGTTVGVIVSAANAVSADVSVKTAVESASDATIQLSQIPDDTRARAAGPEPPIVAGYDIVQRRAESARRYRGRSQRHARRRAP
jgi:hypothetical protein